MSQRLFAIRGATGAENNSESIIKNVCEMCLKLFAENKLVQKDFVSTCIVGAQTRAKVEENAAAFDHELPAEAIAVLDAAIAKLNE